MKIRIHNSILKKSMNFRFILNNKTMLHTNDSGESLEIYLRHQIDDISCFLSFSPVTKEFKDTAQEGKHDKKDWWKKWKWEEVSK